MFVKDQTLAENGRTKVQNTRLDMGGLDNLIIKYKNEQPLKGARITGCVSVTYETANLILTLKELGASLRWCPDNPSASKDDACAYIASEGVPIFATSMMTESELIYAYNEALNFKDRIGKIKGPNLLLDDGCDITRFVHKYRSELLENIFGVSEQTKCGIIELERMVSEGKLLIPAINVNDTRIKLKFDNYYGIQQSLISALDISANIQLRGKTVVISGYGDVGKGCADALSSLGAKVIVTEINPFKALEAIMKGYDLKKMEGAVHEGDVFITATGCIYVIRKEHFLKMKSGAILCNVGHGDKEFDTPYLRNHTKKKNITPYLDEYTLENGKKLRVICDGYLANMRVGSGNPPLGMSITFTNQILAQIELFRNPENFRKGEIYNLSPIIEKKVIELNFPDIANQLTKLTSTQAKYLGVK